MKTCIVCGAEIRKKPTETMKQYEAHKMCSRKCVGASTRGIRRAAEREAIACALQSCGAMFVPTRNGPSFCSAPCVHAAVYHAGKVEAVADGFVIAWAKTGRAYINRSWPTETEATRELADLLKPYPPGDPWRERLKVAPTRRKAAA